MKPDNFEQKLQQQPMRQIPAGWRAEILSAAQAGARKVDRAGTPELPGWRLWLTRFPLAWGAFAALWIAMISINTLLTGSDTRSATGQVAGVSFQSVIAWNHRNAELQELAGDAPSIDTASSAQPPAMNRPRSERRRDWHFGEILHEPTTIV